MSEPKFTKGKWSVGTGKLEGGVVDEQDELICDPSGGRFEEEAKANAALIAAAPELYRMLEKLLMAAKTSNEMNPVKIHHGLIRDVEDTLKEARGEQ